MSSESNTHNKVNNNKEHKYSTSELLASAKIVAEAAQTSFGNSKESNNHQKLDKGKVAKAAGDLLDAVGQYAKLDDNKGLGQYVDKAADYLHHYHPKTTTGSPTLKPDKPKNDDKAHSGGGLSGEFAKVAGGFFK